MGQFGSSVITVMTLGDSKIYVSGTLHFKIGGDKLRIRFDEEYPFRDGGTDPAVALGWALNKWSKDIERRLARGEAQLDPSPIID